MLLRFALALLVLVTGCSRPSEKTGLQSWVTSADKSSLLQKRNLLTKQAVNLPEIMVDTSRTFQTIDGFGYTLTGGSAYLIREKLSTEERQALLRELFSTDSNSIGISYLRVSIGASDLDDHVFSYSDMPDTTLQHFTLAEDQKNLIPLLKEILALQPTIKIMGSPWSAPAWMKTNRLPKGGSLHPDYYATYARYLMKYIRGMAKEGIVIDAITIQNEPENPHNTPSMLMTAEEQADFIKNHLGPAFQQAGITTKIVLFDHNCDHPEYPILILNDAEARKYVDGSAFHLYLGEIDAMSKVHQAHPDKNLYFTEQWTSGQGDFGGDLMWHLKNLIVGATRNHARTVLEWNLAADPQFNPHTDDGGCTLCQGALTIGDGVTRNVSYYIIAHASQFVPPGSVRIDSTVPESLPNTAFVTPAGKKVLIVLNEWDKAQSFVIRDQSFKQAVSLPARSVATFAWP
ncbi:MAG: glycoside hydrolase family 30 protein [Bacteroidota bacterium]